jgi:hypothetical protein
MADLIAELEGVVRLSERADALSYADEEKAYAYRDATIAALDYINTHHAEIAAAVRDARTEREIQNAARYLPEGYAITIYVEKDSGYIDLTGPDGDPVYVHTDDKTMAQQIAEATKVAAMRAGEGEG